MNLNFFFKRHHSGSCNLEYFLWKKKTKDLGESKRQLSGKKRMLNRLAAIYNFRLRNLKLDHCQEGGLAAGLLEHTQCRPAAGLEWSCG